MGAALVAKKYFTFFAKRFVEKDRNWRPLIYCWRGGHRSGAMAKVFSDIGWHTKVIDGGYKAYRKMILDGLDQFPHDFSLLHCQGRQGPPKPIFCALQRPWELRFWTWKSWLVIAALLGSEPGIAQPAQRLF